MVPSAVTFKLLKVEPAEERANAPVLFAVAAPVVSNLRAGVAVTMPLIAPDTASRVIDVAAVMVPAVCAI